MLIKNLTEFPTDYLDAYCEAELGHTNWEFAWVEKGLADQEVHAQVIFYIKPKEDDHDEL